MNLREKESLKKKILKRNELYELQGSRLKRLLKDPIRTFSFYIMQAIAYIKPYKVTKKTLWGVPMSYYLPEGSMIYYYGFFEANVSNFLINFLKEGDVVFDVGAHVGFYSMLSSALVGNTGHVYSFEPTPRTFATLQENTKKLNNSTVHNNAILNEETTIEFFDYGPKYSAFNTFKKRTADEIFFRDDAEKIEVKTLSLDTYTEKNKLSPTFIKIDAEGAESLILESMKQILSTKFPIVSIEVSNTKEWEENLSQSFAIFKDNNYEAYEIDLKGNIQLCNPKKLRVYDNLLFIHPSKKDDISHLIVS